MAVYIRADANARIGLGHFVRCLALADMLGDAFHCTFAMREPAAAIRRQVVQTGHLLLEIPASLALLGEPAWLQQQLAPADLLVLDGYDFTADYQRQLKCRAQALVCLDDLAGPGRLWGDVIINQAGRVEAADYFPEPGTKLCLGPAYALLRRPFREARLLPSREPDTSRVFLNLGGADPDNHTLQLLRALRARLPAQQLVVVTGAAYPHQAALNAEAATLPNVELYHNLGAAELADLLRGCGVMVCPPSGMAYECCAVGGLVLLFLTAANQQRLLTFLTGAGVALPFPALINLAPTEWPALAATLQPRQRQLFDTQAAARLRQVFSELYQTYSLAVRRPMPTDARQYFDWVNDPEVRRNALRPAPIAWEQHQAWFARRLADSKSVLYLFSWQDAPVGQVRIEFEGTTGTIDYSVDAAWRGLGLGRAILRRALTELRRERPGPWTLIGQVKAGNVASGRVFAQLDFRRRSPLLVAGGPVEVFELAVNSSF